MITLKRLRASNFKGLREVDILFPEQGSLLIEGHNEAGKSTLFEAVYVGLYGKPLVGEKERARNDEVIQYNQTKAIVELVVSIGTQIITINRVFERGKLQSQYATMRIQQPGMPPETVNRTRAVNERILKELGNLDGESLRNSCFVEQKELGRIEALQRAERERAIQKLLGLERLTQLMDEFKFRREQERELTTAEQYLVLAQLQERGRAISVRENELAERLDAVRIAGHLKSLAELATQTVSTEQQLQELTLTIQQAQARLESCSALTEQITRSNQIAQSLREIGHARRTLNQTREQLDRLKQIENGDLPEALASLEEIVRTSEVVRQVTQARSQVQETETAVRDAQRLLEKLQEAKNEERQQEENVSYAQARLKQRNEEAALEQQRLSERLHELLAQKARLEQTLSLVTQWEAAQQKLHEIRQTIATTKNKQQEQLTLEQELQRREGVVRNIQRAFEQAELERQQAAEAHRQATAYGELTDWIRLKGVETALSAYAERQKAHLADKQAAETMLVAKRSRRRHALLASAALTVLAILVLLAGFIWIPALFGALCLAGGAIASWVWFLRANKEMQQQFREVDRWDMEIRRLDADRQAAVRAGGDPAALRSRERQLQAIGWRVPSDLASVQKLLEDLEQTPGVTDAYQTRKREQDARENAIRLREQLNQASVAAEESKQAWIVAQQAGNLLEQLSQLAVLETDQEKSVAQAEQVARESFLSDGLWPTTGHAVQTMLSTCQTEIRSTAEAQRQQQGTADRLREEAQVDLEKAQKLLELAQNNVSQQMTSDPVAQLTRAKDEVLQAQTLCKQQEEALQQRLQAINLPSEKEVEPARGRTEARIQALNVELAARPEQMKKCEIQVSDFTQKVIVAKTLLQELITGAQKLSVEALPPFVPTVRNDDNLFPYEDEWAIVLEEGRKALQNTLTSLDEPGTKNRHDKALDERGSLKKQISLIESDRKNHQQQIDSLLVKHQLSTPSAYTRKTLIATWPLVELVTPEEAEAVATELEEIKKEQYATRQQESMLTEELGYAGTPLSIDECQQRVDQLREEREIYLRAQQLLRKTHDRIVRRVLPITERNMQPLLQQLTGGRYRDVCLTPEETDGQSGELDYRIRVWDPIARRFVAKNIFSGGTRDQCSLALRLAFALATLPQELGVAPGFIFLDEPLSAFDAQRAQALVELLTTGTIAQQFSQVVLISHLHAFNREAFRYHIRMEGGQIVESDLPDAKDQEVPLQAALD